MNFFKLVKYLYNITIIIITTNYHYETNKNNLFLARFLVILYVAFVKYYRAL